MKWLEMTCCHDTVPAPYITIHKNKEICHLKGNTKLKIFLFSSLGLSESLCVE